MVNDFAVLMAKAAWMRKEAETHPVGTVYSGMADLPIGPAPQPLTALAESTRAFVAKARAENQQTDFRPAFQPRGQPRGQPQPVTSSLPGDPARHTQKLVEAFRASNMSDMVPSLSSMPRKLFADKTVRPLHTVELPQTSRLIRPRQKTKTDASQLMRIRTDLTKYLGRNLRSSLTALLDWFAQKPVPAAQSQVL